MYSQNQFRIRIYLNFVQTIFENCFQRCFPALIWNIENYIHTGAKKLLSKRQYPNTPAPVSVVFQTHLSNRLHATLLNGIPKIHVETKISFVIKACLNFTRVSFESFLRGCFSVFTRRIAGYLTSENGKKDRKKTQR